MNQINRTTYGIGTNTFDAVGGEKAVRLLVRYFYEALRDDPRFQSIWALHSSSMETAQDKLALFLCGWMGGPVSYKDKYGSIDIPAVHAHLPVTEKERDLWLQCMQEALEKLDLPDDLQSYLMDKLRLPAERIFAVCSEDN